MTLGKKRGWTGQIGNFQNKMWSSDSTKATHIYKIKKNIQRSFSFSEKNNEEKEKRIFLKEIQVEQLPKNKREVHLIVATDRLVWHK